MALNWKPMSKRPIRRTKTSWEDGVSEDIKSMNVRNWKRVVQIRDCWKKVDEQARTLYRLQRLVRRRRIFNGLKMTTAWSKYTAL